jgi:hypothetical protein
MIAKAELKAFELAAQLLDGSSNSGHSVLRIAHERGGGGSI